MLREMVRLKSACLLALLWVLGAAGAWAAVSIKHKGANFLVSASAYQATIDADGRLSSLKVGRRELLKSGMDIAQGCYFTNGLRAGLKVKQEGPAAIMADGAQSSVRYEFADSTMTWLLENRTDKNMWFYIVLDPLLGAVSNGSGELEAFPITRPWSVTEWFAGKTKLRVEGTSRTWGTSKTWSPYAAYAQVLETALAPHGKNRLHLTVSPCSAGEMKKVEQAMFPETAKTEAKLASPKEYQVFQRQTADKGYVIVRGSAPLEAQRVRFRFAGRDRHGKPLKSKWMKANVAAGYRVNTFEQKLQLPAGGWYAFELEVLGKHKKLLASRKLDHVGVGEVFVGAGQSNSTNSGQFPIQQTTDMVSSFSGEGWMLANDPQRGAHDFSGGGSFWPAFGDAMYKRYGVPIGVAVTGHGGTSALQWQPGTDLFAWMIGRMNQLGTGGFRAVLWHQGEGDVRMDPEDYYKLMCRLILHSRAVTGWDFPWFVAKASYHSPQEPLYATVRAVHQRLWDEAIALEGPDTDQLTGDNRDFDGRGVHFSPKGLKAHGQMWAEKVSVYLDKVLENEQYHAW